MMKKEINSSMKKAFYGLDWTICFLWAIGVVVVGYGWFPYFPVLTSSLKKHVFYN